MSWGKGPTGAESYKGEQAVVRHAHRGHMEGLEDWEGGLGCISGQGTT